MELHACRSRGVLGGLVLTAVLCSLGVSAADAGVRAFSALTGAEDSAFVDLGSTARPSAVIPDGRHGVYVVGRLLVHGRSLRIVHVLPNGRIDPVFRVSLGAGTVASGAVRGNELALLGSFRFVDGQRRRNIAVLHARTGRLASWAPVLSEPAVGHGFAHLVFTPTRLVAGVAGAVVAWRDGAREPVWTHRFRVRNDVPEIASWHGSIVAAANGELVAIKPANGRARVASRDFRWSGLQTIGGRLFYQAQGTYNVYGRKGVPRCGQVDDTTAPEALAGTSTTLYVASGPVDADPPAAPTTIFACLRADARLPAFTPPSLPVPQQYVGAMAVVGTHLLVFTYRF
jgi:hypothetical protein